MTDNICILNNLLQVTSQVGGQLPAFIYKEALMATRLFLMLVVSISGDFSERQTSNSSSSGYLRALFWVQRSSPLPCKPGAARDDARPAFTQPSGGCRLRLHTSHHANIGSRPTEWWKPEKWKRCYKQLCGELIHWLSHQTGKISSNKASGEAHSWYSAGCFRADAGESKHICVPCKKKENKLHSYL